MTDIAGILRDKDDPSSIIPCIDIAEARELFEGLSDAEIHRLYKKVTQ